MMSYWPKLLFWSMSMLQQMVNIFENSIRTIFLPGKVRLLNELGQAFYNISRHIVRQIVVAVFKRRHFIHLQFSLN